MTNNFPTIKNNQASEKFYLLRIVPRRVVNDDLSAIGGGKYSVSFPCYIQKVLANSSELTKTSDAGNPGEYSFDEDTMVLTVNSTPSASNIITVYYYIFYTSGRFRVVTEDPENTSTVSRNWEPRIVTSPTIKNSIENVVNGKLGISISNISLINNESEFENYLTPNDSFHKAELKLWLCLDAVENIQKVFDGKALDVLISNSRISFRFDDPLSVVLEPALMGDDASGAYFTVNDFPNLDPNRNNSPIRYMIGTASRYKTISDVSATGLSSAQRLEPLSLFEASCTDYSTSVSTSTNREWGCCRVHTDGFLDFGFVPSNVDNSAGGYTRLDGTFSQIDKFRIGDTFVATYLSTNYYLRVLYVDRTNNYVYVTKETAIATGVTVAGNDCPSIVVSNDTDETHYLLYGRDFTATVTLTSGGNKYLKVTLVNNFEATFGIPTLDPGVFRVRFRVRPNTTNAMHGFVVQSLLENTGLDVLVSSITSANSALPVNCNFSIPYFDQTDYSTYITYVEKILASTLGYISLNNDFEIEYHLFQAPSSTNEITDIDILKSQYKVEIDYKDIVHQIIAYNPHWSSSEAIEDTSNTPSVTETSLKARHLHGIIKTTRFVHVLEKMNTRLSDILAVRSNRKAIYNFATKIINIDNIIGDDIKLVRGGILGGDASKQLKILSLDKSPEQTRILATDLLDL